VLLPSDRNGFRICESLKKKCSEPCPFMEEMKRVSRNAQNMIFFIIEVNDSI